jgi:hypothetical protein
VQIDHLQRPRRSRIVPIILGGLALSILLGLGILIGLIWSDVVAIPNRFNPFTPLRIADDVSWLTRLKLSRLERDGAQCRAVLAGSSVSYRSVPDRPMEQGCGLSDAVQVSRSSVALSREFTATCSLTVAWALFETHVLRPAARQHFGQDVVQVTHFGTYACRNINHRAGGRRSEHATANAIDVAGFVLANGQQITVKNDWAGGNAYRSAFLRTLRNGACDFFDVVLSPDYNEVHHDHFHFDMGSYRTCR